MMTITPATSLPSVEQLQIGVNGAVVTVSHADLSFARTFGDAEQASEYAHSLRGDLFDGYAALVDSILDTFQKQAMGARNG